MSAPDADTMTEVAPKPKQRISLGRSYHRVYTASFISNLGDGVAQIGYPWLASAVTRNPLLIAVVGVAQRLPWLIFTLPAGVITDRVDRRKAMIVMDSCRAVITLAVAISVLGLGGELPAPSALKTVVGTRYGLYSILVVASLLLGFAEVLRDNCAQTIIPSIVDAEHLERANGRMWSAEQVANTFAGPPLGSVLIAAAFFLPFVVDATSFAVAAALVALVVGQFRAKPMNDEPAVPGAWKAEMKEGVRWLIRHPLLRPMALILGGLNLIGALTAATLVLYAQEVLHTTPIEFAVLTMGGAIGGVTGGYLAPMIRRRIGSGPCLWITLAAEAITPIPIGLTSSWPLVFVMFAIGSLVGVLWNVITVSLRQTIIPDELLGRVNSVYRFFAWGMIPIGTALGGLTVVLVQSSASRETALRAPFFVSAALGLILAVYAIPRLTSAKLDGAREEGLAARAARAIAEASNRSGSDENAPSAGDL
ncbi:MAG: putative major facilitator superfamily transporter [Ilumatobacteraceae bacterium]|nr:putative major facilitator superfamily transporter [Ilumatobacteraceae bacterium]